MAARIAITIRSFFMRATVNRIWPVLNSFLQRAHPASTTLYGQVYRWSQRKAGKLPILMTSSFQVQYRAEGSLWNLY